MDQRFHRGLHFYSRLTIIIKCIEEKKSIILRIQRI